MGRENRRLGRVLGAFGAAVGVLALVAPAQAVAATGPAQAGSTSSSSSLSGVTAIATSGGYGYATAYYGGQLTAVGISGSGVPTVAGSSPVASSLLNGTNVAIANGLAYVVSKNRNASTSNNDDGTGNSLTILSLGTSPSIVGTLTDRVNLFGAYGIAVSGGYAYIAAQGCLSGQPCPNASVGDSFNVVNVSNPGTPTLLATIKNSNLPAPWTGTNALKHVTSVAVSGNYAYVTASYSDRLTVIDISNPSSPKIVASLHDATNLNFDVDVAVQGNYAYVADQASGLGRLAVVDISSPTNPKLAATATSATYMNGAYRVRVRGNFAYVSGVYSASIGAVDISDPTHPRVVGGYASTASLNRTTGLDLDSSGRYVVAVSPYLSSQSNATYPPYPGQPNGPTETGTVTTVDLDPAQPVSVTITTSSEPPNPTTQTSASFTFATNDAVAAVQCKLDSGSFGACTSATTQTYSGLASGSHTFTVQATDASGASASASYTWTVSGSGGGGGGTGPTTPVLDSFNRANSTGLGSNWSDIDSARFKNFNVVSNQAKDPSTSYAWDYWNAAQFGPDSEAYATIASPPTGSEVIRIGVRNKPGTTNTGYAVQVSATGAWTIQRLNGSNTAQIASGSTQTLSTGDKILIRATGSTIQGLWYSASSGTWTVLVTATDSTYAGAGYLSVEAHTAVFDDFGGGTIGSGGGGTGTQPPQNSGLPSITGSATVGGTLTASPGTWSGSPTYTYQWQSCANSSCAGVGTNSTTYSPVSGDVGHTIQVVVTATNTGGSAQATSTAVGPVTSSGGGGGGGGGTGPTGSVLDDFNRPDGAAGSNWTLMRSSSYEPMNVSGNLAVDSNTALYAWNMWNASTYTDASAYVTVVSYGSDTIRIGARATAGTGYHGYYVAITNTGAWSILRIDNGGSPITLKSGVTQALAAGDKVGIQIVGTVITAWFNRGGTWTSELTYDTAGDSTRYSSGGLALEFRYSTLDNFSGG